MSEEQAQYDSGSGHDRTCRCDACVEYWERQQVEPDRVVEKQEKHCKVVAWNTVSPYDMERDRAFTNQQEQHFEKKFSEWQDEAVNHPRHYTSHPSGVEVIQITEHENFCRGNAIKYILRASKKGSEIEDLQKAAWYINREIERLKNEH
jgi:hypothetical protein